MSISSGDFSNFASATSRVRSLLDVFKDEKGTIYSDDIHPRRELMDSRGYTLMAARMAQEMAGTWGWGTKPQH
jgi:hypothetical protein